MIEIVKRQAPAMTLTPQLPSRTRRVVHYRCCDCYEIQYVFKYVGLPQRLVRCVACSFARWRRRQGIA